MKGRAADQLHALRTHDIVLGPRPLNGVGTASNPSVADWGSPRCPSAKPLRILHAWESSESNPLLSDSDMSEWYLNFARGNGFR